MKAPKSLMLDDAAVVDLADCDLGGQGLDHAPAAFGARRRRVRDDHHRAVVLDVDLGAGLLLDARDGLAARADEQADLLRVDLDRQQARGVAAMISARGAGIVVSIVREDFEAGLAGLLRARRG